MKKLLFIAPALLVLFTAFIQKKKNKPRLPEEYVFIPGGTYSIKSDSDDVMTEKPGNRAVVISFYMSKYEVSNLQYRQFYNEVSVQMPEEEKQKIACDSLGWRNELTYSEPLVEYYYRHPSFNNYPAVNIPYEGALAYCRWLQEKLKENNPGFEIEVSLPSKEQFVWAAQGKRSNAMYPWGNYYLRNNKGEFLCNFKKLGDQAITRNRQTGKPEVHEESYGLSDKSFYTASVKSFYPNDFGLYNTCGNAAEMINQEGIAMGGSWNDFGGDVHIRSESVYEKPLPTVGFRPVITVKEKKQ